MGEKNITLIVIIIDGKWNCSFNGILEQWKQERFFKVITPKIYTSIVKLASVANTIRVKKLRISGSVYSELDAALALFCYDMLDPTRKRIQNDMHQYEVEQYQNKSRH